MSERTPGTIELPLPDDADMVCMGIVVWARIDRSEKPTDVGEGRVVGAVEIHATVHTTSAVEVPQNLLQYVNAVRLALDKCEAAARVRLS